QSAAEMRAELKRLKRDTSSGRVVLPESVRTGKATVVATPAASSAPALQPAKRKIKPVLFGALGLIAIIAVIAGIYFTRNQQRGFNLQNMKITQVTATGNAGAAALSPDRRYIVYVLRNGAQESLWVQQLATGSNVQILPPEQVTFVAVTFTPDGNYVM